MDRDKIVVRELVVLMRQPGAKIATEVVQKILQRMAARFDEKTDEYIRRGVDIQRAVHMACHDLDELVAAN